ncbi:MAG: hypothetical protein M0R51_04005, partial [Clostridia bacterium]|nr:hypothetical protein [Clostridia bacterium]
TLREQTIGRGLRLPYGRITGNIDVDRLTIVAHDKFREIVDQANDENSILRKENVIYAEDIDLEPKQIVRSETKAEQESKLVMTAVIKQQMESVGKEFTENEQRVVNIINEITSNEITKQANAVNSLNELNTEENKEIIMQNVISKISANVEANSVIKDYGEIYNRMIVNMIDIQTKIIAKNNIELPRITVMPDNKQNLNYKDFDLDTSGNAFNFVPSKSTLVFQNLKSNEISESGIEAKNILIESPENTIINLLIDKPDISYDDCSELLFKLVGQALKVIKNRFTNEKDVVNIVQNYKVEIADLIFVQILKHIFVSEPELKTSIAYSYSKILPHNFERYLKNPIKKLFDRYTGSIAEQVFTGFNKDSHNLYKFDSEPEKIMAIVLENDSKILKWLRPSEKQFNLFYGQGREKQYEPDFVAETDNAIYLIEVKDHTKMENEDVQSKKRTALKYCEIATLYNKQLNKKPWKYLLIPDDKVSSISSFSALTHFEEK